MYARWVLSRCTRLLHARTHQCQPPLARLATRQHQQHHQYFPLLTVLVQYVQQGCPCNSARNGPSQVTITRQMANFPATLYVLASSFPSFVASRPRSNAIRGKFSKTFEDTVLFYSILFSFIIGEKRRQLFSVFVSWIPVEIFSHSPRPGTREGALVYCLQLNNIT